MQPTIFHLSTCNSCKKVLAKLNPPKHIILQDLKTEPVSVEQLKKLVALAGNHETLFNRRARLYTTQKLKEKKLTETDYKELILSHYTFLKRPIVVLDKEIFIGYSTKTIESASKAISIIGHQVGDYKRKN